MVSIESVNPALPETSLQPSYRSILQFRPEGLMTGALCIFVVSFKILSLLVKLNKISKYQNIQSQFGMLRLAVAVSDIVCWQFYIGVMLLSRPALPPEWRDTLILINGGDNEDAGLNTQHLRGKHCHCSQDVLVSRCTKYIYNIRSLFWLELAAWCV